VLKTDGSTLVPKLSQLAISGLDQQQLMVSPHVLIWISSRQASCAQFWDVTPQETWCGKLG
jgi:hypothetical protein